MSRSVLAGAAILAVASVIPQIPATAQGNSSIIVSAPAVGPADRNAGQPRNSVHPQRQLVTNVMVDTSDLNLRTAYGRAVLDARLRLAADAACDRLDEIDPPIGVGGWIHDMGDCRHLAVKRAQTQRWAAIRASG
jgi:UrcA family protein